MTTTVAPDPRPDHGDPSQRRPIPGSVTARIGTANHRRRLAPAVTKTLLTLAATAATAATILAVAAPASAKVIAGPATAKLVWIPRAGHRIAAYVHPGRGPAIVLCHGFPDNHHLYDRVVPLLKGREVVTFDFLGWGRSSKPAHYSYTFAGQEQDLDAVIEGLHLHRVVLVAHDASVPAVLNWTLDHPRPRGFGDPLKRLLLARPGIRPARSGRHLRGRSIPRHGTARAPSPGHRLRAQQPHERAGDRPPPAE